MPRETPALPSATRPPAALRHAHPTALVWYFSVGYQTPYDVFAHLLIGKLVHFLRTAAHRGWECCGCGWVGEMLVPLAYQLSYHYSTVARCNLETERRVAYYHLPGYIAV